MKDLHRALVLFAVSMSVSVSALELDTIGEFRVAAGLEDEVAALAEAVIAPSVSGWLGESVFFKAGVRARADFADELEPGRPGNDFRARFSQRVTAGSIVDIELRNFYVDVEFDDHVLRLGKQQIVWGEADGLKVLDVVNPQSFREFILPDFDDSRIPLWTANLELALGSDTNLQLLWVPDNTYHDLPDPGARFALASPLLLPAAPAGVAVQLLSPRRPSRVVADSDAGFRLSTFRGGWELSLNYFYHYDDAPVLRTSTRNRGVVITPEYQRTHLAGGSFNYATGAYVVRGELGYSSRRAVRRQHHDQVPGVYNTGELAWVLGLDYDGVRDTFISGQLFQSVATAHRPGTMRDKLESNLSLLVRRDFRNETINAELLAIHGLNDNDGVLQFSVDYVLRSNLTVTAGVDLFYGDRDGLFGQFDRQDRLTLGIEVGF